MGGVAPEVGGLPRQKEKSNRALGVGVCAHARAQARRAGCEPAHRKGRLARRERTQGPIAQALTEGVRACARGEQVATETPPTWTAARRTPPNATVPTPGVGACRMGGLSLGRRRVCP